MKKVLFSLCAVFFSAGLFTSCLFGSNEAKISKRPITLRLSEVHAKDYPTSLADEEFSRLVEEKTEGRVIIEVRTGGALSSNETDA